MYIYIYTDFQKAFDSVSHKRLQSKIKSYGIEGNMLNWINTFLNNRKQRVLINGRPYLFIVEKGPKWGSPEQRPGANIICHIYINDIVDNLNSRAYFFADDMNLYRRINDRL